MGSPRRPGQGPDRARHRHGMTPQCATPSCPCAACAARAGRARGQAHQILLWVTTGTDCGGRGGGRRAAAICAACKHTCRQTRVNNAAATREEMAERDLPRFQVVAVGAAAVGAQRRGAQCGCVPHAAPHRTARSSDWTLVLSVCKLYISCPWRFRARTPCAHCTFALMARERLCVCECGCVYGCA